MIGYRVVVRFDDGCCSGVFQVWPRVWDNKVRPGVVHRAPVFSRKPVLCEQGVHFYCTWRDAVGLVEERLSYPVRGRIYEVWRVKSIGRTTRKLGGAKVRAEAVEYLALMGRAWKQAFGASTWSLPNP